MAAQGSFYIEKAYERLTEISADDLKRLEYEAREKAIRDHNYLMDYNLELGIKKGLDQGAKALIETCRDYSCSREEAFSRLVEKLSLSSEEAEK